MNLNRQRNKNFIKFDVLFRWRQRCGVGVKIHQNTNTKKIFFYTKLVHRAVSHFGAFQIWCTERCRILVHQKFGVHQIRGVAVSVYLFPQKEKNALLFGVLQKGSV